MSHPPAPEEQSLASDPRLGEAIALFNQGEWYACHDVVEALWHETAGPMRPVLQGILQIAVAQLHRERGNRRGATVLMGEGLGRLRQVDGTALGLNIELLRTDAAVHLSALQREGDEPLVTLPRLSLQPAASI